MGDINCHCHLPGTLQDQITFEERTIQLNNINIKPAEKIIRSKHRVKSIVSPRMASHRKKNGELNSFFQSLQNSRELPSPTFSDLCQLTLKCLHSDQLFKLEVDQKGIIAKCEGPDSLIRTPSSQSYSFDRFTQIREQKNIVFQTTPHEHEQFALEMKYSIPNQCIFARDLGIGLGVFKKFNGEVTIKMEDNFNTEDAILQIGIGFFLVVRKKKKRGTDLPKPNQSIQCQLFRKRMNQTDQNLLQGEENRQKISRSLPSLFHKDSGSTQTQVEISSGQSVKIDESVSIANDWPHISIKTTSSRPIFKYLSTMQPLGEGEVVRCGPILYQIVSLDKYINSSRIVLKH